MLTTETCKNDLMRTWENLKNRIYLVGGYYVFTLANVHERMVSNAVLCCGTISPANVGLLTFQVGQ